MLFHSNNVQKVVTFNKRLKKTLCELVIAFDKKVCYNTKVNKQFIRRSILWQVYLFAMFTKDIPAA